MFTRDLSPFALTLVLCAATLAACGGGSKGRDGIDGASALAAVSAEPAGAQCTAGGQRIASGIDSNANGALDAAEIASTQYVCHGSAGAAGAVGAAGTTGLAGAAGASGAAGAAGLATLVQLMAEPAGVHCATGGTRVDAGLDANTNGALDPSEISSSAYVCGGVAGVNGTNGTNGTNGSNGAAGSNGHNTLMSVVAENAGVNCTAGGSRVTSGLDANGNNVLDALEVSSTAYACHGSNGSSGSNGINSLVAVVAETAGTNCTAGGSKLTSGLDTNGNAILDLAEVTSTAYVCQGAAGPTGANGANGANGGNGSNGTNGTDGYTTLALSVGETAGANCAAGGIKITSGRDLSRDGSLDLGEVQATSYVCNGLAAIGWVDVTSLTVQAVRNTGYVADNAAQVTVQLPATSAVNVGDIVRVSGAGTGGWKIAQAAGQSIVTSNLDVASVAKTWTDHGYQDGYRSVASSADGNRLVAAPYAGELITSADGGVTWSFSGLLRNWTAVASSADGSRLVAVGYNTDIYVSVNYGATWQSVAGGSTWVAVASSANGRVLAAARAGGQIDVSEDYGVTWASRGSNKYWSTIALSADGSRMVAAENGGTVDVSSDFGVTWSTNSPTAAWRSVATSADGRRFVAVAEYAPIYTSDDFGVTWTARETARFWAAVTSSADGTRLLAAVTLDQNAVFYDIAFLYASSDQGVTWTQRATDDNWSAVASSADGGRLVAVTNFGAAGISTSVPRRMTATTTGITGSIIGRQDQALELQYVGSGRFIVLDAIGDEFEAN